MWTAYKELNPKTQYLACKVMTSLFWDEHGIIFIKYLKKAQGTIANYIEVLERLKDEIVENYSF